MQRQELLAILLFMACLEQTGTALSQDAHYWDNQYGTTAELLGGLVVGSATDLSATFYNPGWIALNSSPSLLLTSKAAEAYRITIDNDFGGDIDPSSTTITPSPGYMAGRFSLSKNSGWKWAYTYLQRVQFEYNASGMRIDANQAPPPAGEFWFSGEAFRDAQVTESWYGITAAHRINEHLAVGFSPYAAQRSQRSRSQLTAQALSDESVYTNGYLVDEYDYWNLRILMKMGLAADWQKWSAGLTITTPSLNVMGSGTVYQNVSLSGEYRPNEPGLAPPYLQANRQEELDTTWKSPLSVAAGGAVRLGATRIHLTLEWFNSIGRFQVMSPSAYEIQSLPGQFTQYELEYAAKNVLNYGLGADHAFGDKLSFYLSYRRDNSTTPDNLGNDISIANWDLNHVSSGISFHFLSMEFTTGLQYSWGDGLTDQFADFGDGENGQINGRLNNQRVTYDRLKALLGFNLPFAVPID